MIDDFSGEYEFLSNFYPAPITYCGLTMPTAEHAFAAAKTESVNDILRIAQASTPGEAKGIGRGVTLRPNWDQIKFAMVSDIVRIKFETHPELAEKLVATRGALLVEGNIWHDQIWGSCTCSRHKDIPGDNALGTILMYVRMQLAAGL